MGGALEEVVQVLDERAAGSVDLLRQCNIDRIPGRVPLAAGSEPGVALVLDTAEIHERPNVILFHVEQVPVEKQSSGAWPPLDELLGVFCDQPDLKPVSQAVESWDPLSILDESGLAAVLCEMYRPFLSASPAEVDGSRDFQAAPATALERPMLGPPKASTSAEQKDGLQQGGLPGPVGTYDPIDVGRRIKLDLVDVSQS